MCGIVWYWESILYLNRVAEDTKALLFLIMLLHEAQYIINCSVARRVTTFTVSNPNIPSMRQRVHHLQSLCLLQRPSKLSLERPDHPVLVLTLSIILKLPLVALMQQLLVVQL